MINSLPTGRHVAYRKSEGIGSYTGFRSLINNIKTFTSHKKCVTATFLIVLFAAGNLLATEIPKTGFEDMYENVVAYVMSPEHHPGIQHGEVHPEFGDAKAYCPAWVYLRDTFDGSLVDDTELRIADEMIARYQEYFEKFRVHPFLFPLTSDNALMHVAIGVEGVLKAHEHKPREEYRVLTRQYLDLIQPIMKHPEIICWFHMQPYGPTTVEAGGAWFYLSYPLTFGLEDEKSLAYKNTGLAILAKLDERLYSKEEGKYLYSLQKGFDFTYAYTNMVIVQALVRAYVLTGERRYYERGIAIMKTLEKDLYYSAYDGFLSAENKACYSKQYDRIGPQYNREYMCLSTHNYMIFAYLALYEASGFTEPDMIEKSRTCLDFIKKWLWKDTGRIEHHIERGVIAPPEDYCIGCSYQTLYNVWLLKAAMMKVPVQGLYREAK